MGVGIVGGGVGVLPVLVDLIQTSDQRRGYDKSPGCSDKAMSAVKGANALEIHAGPMR